MRRFGWILCAMLFGSLVVISPARAACQSYAPLSLASISSFGEIADYNSNFSTISANGRYVAFNSSASNLTLSPSSNTGVYIYDRQNCIVESFRRPQWNLLIYHNLTLSADGRYLAFTGMEDSVHRVDRVFIHDRRTDITEMIPPISTALVTGSASQPSLSADGRFVAFTSDINLLVPNDSNNTADVFVLDRRTEGIQRVSIMNDGTEFAGGAQRPQLSADGRFVLFASPVLPIVPDSTHELPQYYIYDRLNYTLERVVPPQDSLGNEGWIFNPVLSGDGRSLAYTFVVSPGNWAQSAVYWTDRFARRTEIASPRSHNGATMNLFGQVIDISVNGRYLYVQSLDEQVAYFLGIINGGSGVPFSGAYRYDTLTHEIVSVLPETNLLGHSFVLQAVSDDGTAVGTTLQSLIQTDTNSMDDIAIIATDRDVNSEFMTSPTPISVNLLTNGEFGIATPWVATNPAQIDRMTVTFHPEFLSSAGVLSQTTVYSIPTGTVLDGIVSLGSAGTVGNVTVMLHDRDFNEFFACVFNLPTNSPPRPYRIRARTHETWEGLSLSIYTGATGDNFLRVDNTDLRATLDSEVGESCVEPEWWAD